MIRVILTANLQKYFPEREFLLEANSVLDLLHKMDERRPQFSSYILEDDRSVRKHVNIFVNNELLEKENTAAVLQAGDTVHIMQALSGG